jgi:chromatin structure-remodeling complex subunit RSC4
VDEQNSRKLGYVSVLTRPLGRLLCLDHKDGVKSWSVRLGRGEVSVSIADVSVMNPGETEDDSDVERKGKERERANENERREEEEEEEGDGSQHRQKRGRGQSKKIRSIAEESPKRKGKSVAMQPREDVQVKLNGSPIDPAEGESPSWDVNLVLGSNLVEVGEPHGQTWKLYLERMF